MFLEGNGCPETASQNESCAEAAKQKTEEGMWLFLISFFIISLNRKGRSSQILGNPERDIRGATRGHFMVQRPYNGL